MYEPGPSDAGGLSLTLRGALALSVGCCPVPSNASCARDRGSPWNSSLRGA